MRFATVFVLIFSLLSAPLVYASQATKVTYTNDLKRVTRKGQMYNYTTWDAKIIWRATFFDDQFRREFAKKHAAIKYMGPLETAEWMADQQYIQEREWDFIVVLYSKKDYKKFSMDPDSFWEALMTTADGETVYPKSIEQISITPYEKVMFPYIDRWSKIYRVSFPKVALSKDVSLTMRSIVGQSTLTWKTEKN